MHIAQQYFLSVYAIDLTLYVYQLTLWLKITDINNFFKKMQLEKFIFTAIVQLLTTLILGKYFPNLLSTLFNLLIGQVLTIKLTIQ